MENITEEEMKLYNTWSAINTQIERVNGIIEDMKTCKNTYTKLILFSELSKIVENLGLKEKLFG